jgi:hypothetical protein
MLQLSEKIQRRRIAEIARRERRLGKSERKRAVARIAPLLKSGEPTPFAFEASCRHDLRAEMCLTGIPWARANATAAEIVAEALAAIGARRPSWNEGQPRWTQEGWSPIERTRCVTCGGRLPEGHRLYCSAQCFEFKRFETRHKHESAYDFACRRARRWSSPETG